LWFWGIFEGEGWVLFVLREVFDDCSNSDIEGCLGGHEGRKLGGLNDGKT